MPSAAKVLNEAKRIMIKVMYLRIDSRFIVNQTEMKNKEFADEDLSELDQERRAM